MLAILPYLCSYYYAIPPLYILQILPEIQQAVDDVTADAKQFPADARSWRQGLTSRYNAWTRFRKGLEQYIQSVTDLRTRVGTEIDAQPFWVFLKDLDVFKKVLKVRFFNAWARYIVSFSTHNCEYSTVCQLH